MDFLGGVPQGWWLCVLSDHGVIGSCEGGRNVKGGRMGGCGRV
jgi:hypothetical protein